MKNFLLVSNILLLFLVGYLYYLSFHNKSTVLSVSHSDSLPKHLGANVAYIDLDSLQSHYDYYKIIRNNLEQKQNASSNEFSSLQKRYQARAADLQQKSATMTPQQQDQAGKEIQQMQQDLQNKKQQLDNDLYVYNTKMKEDILSKIQTYLKVYNKSGKYDYIFSYEPGFMFYKDSTLNITKDVIAGLNDQFSKEKK
ncbi:MAG: OmpH family outer membrane protein [Ginsengibacter sp.]